MGIIISENGKSAQKLDEIHFGLEDQLQQYVKNNPDIIPLYEIREDLRLLVLAREFMTNSGPIDALGIDQEGNFYVIETKLYKNADKRTVVAQALDYGASLWRHSGDASDLLNQLDNAVHKHFGVSLQEKVEDFFEVDDSQNILNSVSQNIKSGNIKFVILMDSVEDRLKDLVTYVNQNSRFDIYAVDLEYYKHDKFEIVIPKLYGAEVKKTIAQDSDNRFDNQKIITWINDLNLSNIKIDLEHTTKSYLRFTTANMDKLLPPRDDMNSGWKNGNAYYYEVPTDKGGWAQVQFVLNSSGVNASQKRIQEQIIETVDRNPRKPEWTWFMAQTWKVNYKSGDEVLRQEITRIISEDIPNFEQNLTQHILS